MKCSRCASEIPAQSQFCMKCGSAVAAPRSGGTATMVRPAHMAGPASGSRTKLLAGICAAVIVLAAAVLWAAKTLNLLGKTAEAAPGSKVLEAQGGLLPGGPLLSKEGRIGPTQPLTNKTGIGTPSAPQPAEVVDYLAFLRRIEGERVVLSKKQLGELLAMSPKLTQLGAGSAIESGEPEKEARQSVMEFQQAMSGWEGQWQSLSTEFRSKPAPQVCVALQSKYYEVLASTSGAIVKAGNAFNKAMSGDASAALDTLTGMRGAGPGSASSSIGAACQSADLELGRVCDKYRITKDFSIQDEGSGANLLAH